MLKEVLNAERKKQNDYYCITILDEFGRSGSTAYVGKNVIFENYKNSNMTYI